MERIENQACNPVQAWSLKQVDSDTVGNLLLMILPRAKTSLGD